MVKRLELESTDGSEEGGCDWDSEIDDREEEDEEYMSESEGDEDKSGEETEVEFTDDDEDENEEDDPSHKVVISAEEAIQNFKTKQFTKKNNQILQSI